MSSEYESDLMCLQSFKKNVYTTIYRPVYYGHPPKLNFMGGRFPKIWGFPIFCGY